MKKTPIAQPDPSAQLERVKRMAENLLGIPTGAANWIDFLEIALVKMRDQRAIALRLIFDLSPLVDKAGADVDFARKLWDTRYRRLAAVNDKAARLAARRIAETKRESQK